LNLNAQQDLAGAFLSEQYIGPIYWDYGAQAPVADWHEECQANVARCRDAYSDEILRAEGMGGVVLVHDIHATTMELLMGKNWQELLKDPNASDAADGFIVRMQKMGYKFVALDSHQDAVSVLLKGKADTPVEPLKPIPAAAAGVIEAKVGTWIKKRVADSSTLSESEKCFVRPREQFAISSKEEAQSGHLKVVVKTAYKAEACQADFWNRDEYFVFAEHYIVVK